MEHEVKNFLNNIHSSNVKKILEPHIKGIIIDEKEKNVNIIVDQTYTMNQLAKTKEFEVLIKGVELTYGEGYTTVIKLNSFDDTNFKREINIPHQIHY